MSKLEELIQKYCPDGVEYVKLGDIMSIQRGASPRPIQNYLTNDEKGVPWIKIGDVSPESKYIISTKERVTKDGAAKSRFLKRGSFILSNSMSFGRPYILEIDGCIHDGWISMCDFEKHLLPGFLYYLLRSNVVQDYWTSKANSGGAVANLNSDIVRSTQIPVPPLPVQEEIVRILDTFTELQAELQAELQKRLQQYNYYKEKILTNSSATDAKEYTLQDLIISLKTGLNPRQNFKLNQEGASCPYITGKDIYSNKVNVSERTDRISFDDVAFINKRAKLESNLLLFASTGTGTVGRMAVIDSYNNDWNISETLYAIKPDKNLISTRFLMYSLYADYVVSQFSPKISKGSVPHLKVSDLLKVKIQVPSLEEQEKIVILLDRFDSLTNDLTAGLPAEIEKRRRQYEYYRDKLLTFKRKES